MSNAVAMGVAPETFVKRKAELQAEREVGDAQMAALEDYAAKTAVHWPKESDTDNGGS